MPAACIVPVNLLDGAVITSPVPGAWSPGLGNLTDLRIISAPAVCLAPGNASASSFVVDFGRRERWDVVALLALVDVSGRARVRLTGADDLGFTRNVNGGQWWPMVPRVHRTYPTAAGRSLPWSARNFWTGQPTARELDAWGRNCIVEAAGAGRYLRVEIDDPSPAGSYAIGYAVVGSYLPLTHSYSRGATHSLEWRTIIDRTPSGHKVFETRRTARRYELPWTSTDTESWMAIADMAIVSGPERPVLFLAAAENGRQRFRETFLAQLSGAPAGEVMGYGRRRTSLIVEEVIA